MLHSSRNCHETSENLRRFFIYPDNFNPTMAVFSPVPFNKPPTNVSAGNLL
ncbi:hypothetical protein HMPREF9103_00622 [Lentilactobacillus parafarraginis F0439]|uniref:Uncharacterized protein n=1 Tax=Lentilactobacillus parafarraginis F0439 TaxID=797515 RepID=G9ZLM4_9LACO|nr:hypothetical protein HMPREF9103_00622 [Lentilactobacillus parafarraginis F0439]